MVVVGACIAARRLEIGELDASKLIEEAKEIQRQEASRIVVPGMGGGGDMSGRGGKITLR